MYTNNTKPESDTTILVTKILTVDNNEVGAVMADGVVLEAVRGGIDEETERGGIDDDAEGGRTKDVDGTIEGAVG